MTKKEMIFFWNSVWPWDFLDGPVVGNLPANAEYTGLIPVQEDPTCYGVTKPLRHIFGAGSPREAHALQ